MLDLNGSKLLHIAGTVLLFTFPLLWTFYVMGVDREYVVLGSVSLSVKIYPDNKYRLYQDPF